MKKFIVFLLIVFVCSSIYDCTCGRKKTPLETPQITKADLDVFIPMAKHHSLTEKQLTEIVTALKLLKVDYNRIIKMEDPKLHIPSEKIYFKRVNKLVDDSYYLLVYFGKNGNDTVYIDRISLNNDKRTQDGHKIAERRHILYTLDKLNFTDEQLEHYKELLLQNVKKKNIPGLEIEEINYKLILGYKLLMEVSYSGLRQDSTYGSTDKIKTRGNIKINLVNGKVDD